MLDKRQKRICSTVSPKLAASLGDPLVILIDYMVFLSPFLDVIKMTVLAVNFFAQLASGVHCLDNAFLRSLIQMAFKSRMNRNFSSLGSL